MTEQELLDLKQEIIEAKESLNKITAKKDVLMDEMKKKFGVSTIAAARKKVEKMTQEIEEQEQQIQGAMEELELKLEE